MGQSDIVTKFKPDPPIVLNAQFDRGDADRRRIDDQIIGTQKMLADGLLNGVVCSWFKLSPTSSPLSAGMAFCVGIDGLMTKGTGAASTAAGTVVGVAASSVSPGASFRGALLGNVPNQITALGPGVAGPVRVNPTTARLERVVTEHPSDLLLGFADLLGNMTLVRGASTGGGGGGGGATLVRVVAIDGDVLATSGTTDDYGDTLRSDHGGLLQIDSISPMNVGDLILHGGVETGDPLFLHGLYEVIDQGAVEGETEPRPWVVGRVLPMPTGLVYVQEGVEGTGTYWLRSGELPGFMEVQLIPPGGGSTTNPTAARYVDPLSVSGVIPDGSIANPYHLVSDAVADLGTGGTIYVFGGDVGESITLPGGSQFVIEGLGYPGASGTLFPVRFADLSIHGSGSAPTIVRLRRARLAGNVIADGQPSELYMEDSVVEGTLNSTGAANLMKVRLIRSEVIGGNITCVDFAADDSKIGHDVTAALFATRRCSFTSAGTPQIMHLLGAGTKATMLECDWVSFSMQVLFASGNNELVMDPYTYGLATIAATTGGFTLTNGYLHCLGDETPTVSITANTTLNQTHANRYLRVNFGGAQLTIPPQATTPWARGTEFEGLQVHLSGPISFIPGAGVTINPSGVTTRGQWSWWRLKQVSTNTWDLTGDLSNAGGGAVSSVFGRTGAVVAVAGDYDALKISNASASTGANVDAALSNIHNQPDFAVEFNNGTLTGSVALDYTRGPAQRFAMSGNTTLTIVNMTGTNIRWLQLRVTQANSSGFATLAIAGAKTPGGTPLILSTTFGAIDLVNVYWDGTTIYASVAGLGFA